MGQTQDKVEGEEQTLDGGLEESRPGHDFGDMDGRDVTEGEFKEEVTEESGDQDSLHQKQRSSTGPTTSSSERHKQLWESRLAASEVRQGGAAEEEGGGRITSHGADKDHRSSSGAERLERTQKLLNQINTNPRKVVEHLQAPSENGMEHQAEDTVPQKDENSVDESFLDGSDQEPGMLRSNTYGAQTGSELLPVPALNEAEKQDVKLNEGTEGCASERKEPPARPPHPLKNNPKKESLLDISAAIQHGASREKTQSKTEETPKDVGKSVSNEKPEVTDADDLREADGQHPQMDSAETNEVMPSDPASNTALLTEPSSILEKLLKRNKTEATPSLFKIKEVQDALYVPERDRFSAANQNDQSGNDKKVVAKTPVKDRDSQTLEQEIKETASAQKLTSDSLCFQPVVNDAMSKSSLTKPHSSRGEGVKVADSLVNVEVKRRLKPSQSLPLNNSPSAVSHGRTSCEVSGVIFKESALYSGSHAELLPAKSHGQIEGSSQIPTAEKSDIKTKTPGSDRADHKSGSGQVLQEGCDDAAAPAGDAGAVLVADGTALTQGSHQVSGSMKQELNSENTPPSQSERTPRKESDASVALRDKSEGTPKSKPVSELIKETIQLHEKLQHHDRPKPAEVKCEEQGQSVKVAQMKAAFDSPLKSAEKAMERKPSMRRGKKHSGLVCV